MASALTKQGQVSTFPKNPRRIQFKEAEAVDITNIGKEMELRISNPKAPLAPIKKSKIPFQTGTIPSVILNQCALDMTGGEKKDRAHQTMIQPLRIISAPRSPLILLNGMLGAFNQSQR